MTPKIPTNIRPKRDRVLIDPIEDPKETEGGIVIPDVFRKNHTALSTTKTDVIVGYLVALGDGMRSEKTGIRKPITDMEVGEIVAYKRHPRHDVYDDDGHHYHLLPVDLVVGVVEDYPQTTAKDEDQ